MITLDPNTTARTLIESNGSAPPIPIYRKSPPPKIDRDRPSQTGVVASG